MPRTIPISKYVPKKFGNIELKNLSVFKLEAIPKSSPIDLNVAALSEESGWSLSDRLRFWHTLNGESLSGNPADDQKARTGRASVGALPCRGGREAHDSE